MKGSKQQAGKQVTKKKDEWTEGKREKGKLITGRQVSKNKDEREKERRQETTSRQAIRQSDFVSSRKEK
jgi:hypothetical protein